MRGVFLVRGRYRAEPVNKGPEWILTRDGKRVGLFSSKKAVRFYMSKVSDWSPTS